MKLSDSVTLSSRAAGHVDDGSFRQLVEGVFDYAVYMLDPAGNVATWNAGARPRPGRRRCTSSRSTTMR